MRRSYKKEPKWFYNIFPVYLNVQKHSTVFLQYFHSPRLQTLHREAEWMRYVLCGWESLCLRRYKMPASHLCGLRKPLSLKNWPVVRGYAYCGAWKCTEPQSSTDSKICHSSQSCRHCHCPSCLHPCKLQLCPLPYRSIQSPSSNGCHSYPPCTAPAASGQTCLGARGMICVHCSSAPLCFPWTGVDLDELLEDSGKVDSNLHRQQDSNWWIISSI